MKRIAKSRITQILLAVLVLSVALALPSKQPQAQSVLGGFASDGTCDTATTPRATQTFNTIDTTDPSDPVNTPIDNQMFFFYGAFLPFSQGFFLGFLSCGSDGCSDNFTGGDATSRNTWRRARLNGCNGRIIVEELYFNPLPGGDDDCGNRSLILHSGNCGTGCTVPDSTPPLAACIDATDLSTHTIEYGIDCDCNGTGVVKITLQCGVSCPL